MRRLAWPVVVLLLAAVGVGYGLYTQTRIASLEASVQRLEAEPRASPADEPVVVGKEVRFRDIQDCVRYQGFGRVEETCVIGGEGKTSCYTQARIGARLPDACR